MKPIFITDSQMGRIRDLKANARSVSNSVRILEPGKLAYTFLEQSGESFSAIFLPTTSVNPGIFDLVTHTKRFHPVTPIYLIREKGYDIPEIELNRLGISGAMDPSVNLQDYFSRVSMIPDSVFATRAFDFSLPPSIKNQTKFTPVPIGNFPPNTKLYFDVYAHVIADKFIQICKATEVLSLEKLTDLVSRGVSHLYLNSESFQKHLNYCKSMSKLFLESETLPPQVKFLSGVSLNSEVRAVLDAKVPAEFELDPIEDYVEKTFSWVFESKNDLRVLLKAYLQTVHLMEHASAVSVLCAVLAQAMKIESQDSIRRLGIASLVHDIGLNFMPPELHHEDRLQMTEEQRKLFETHPAKGAELLRNSGIDDELILQIVAQHHERRNETGFPRRKSPAEINVLSEIVGLAEEYVIFKKAHPDVSNKEIADHFENFLFDGFSQTAVNAARIVFVEWANQASTS